MQDPEAADAILRSGVETTMICLDVTHQAVLTRRDIERWRRLGTAAGDFLAGMTDFYIDAYSATQPSWRGAACMIRLPWPRRSTRRWSPRWA